MRVYFVAVLWFLSYQSQVFGSDEFLSPHDIDGKIFIKSISSNLCHPPTSPYRKRLKVYADGTNSYQTLNACIADGGDLPKSMREELKAEDPIVEEEIVKAETKAKEDAAAGTKFAGINWGLGLAFTKLGVKAVKDVSIEGTEIRVNHTAKNKAVALVESHYFFVHEGKRSTWGHGPFIAIGLIAEDGVDPLSNYGFGYMFGFKNLDGTSWNVGLGQFFDTDVPRLRDGLNDGDSTSETDPTKLVTREDEQGLMLMFSANF